ncbi:hypothetical protein [Methylomicrobium album]|uniref:Uncharacterized protein n=1 Tax=Methylomicrobium album BG8 TaxID=686340 RepID=H8GNK9_METAL|nr:hypothetical protein [Methylomicrobium album]EIC29602.1 hypothetical protein Metal_1835 [Methylomicrobium album BG8]
MKQLIKSALHSFLLIAVCVIVKPVFSQDLNPTEKSPAAAEFNDAQQENPQLTIDVLTAPIKSKAELNKYLQTTPIPQSPLRFLSHTHRLKEFLSSLYFGPRGLTSYKTPALEALTPTQAYQILSLFGLQSTVSMLTSLVPVTPLDNVIMTNTTAAPAISCIFGRDGPGCEARSAAICCRS